MSGRRRSSARDWDRSTNSRTTTPRRASALRPTARPGSTGRRPTGTATSISPHARRGSVVRRHCLVRPGQRVVGRLSQSLPAVAPGRDQPLPAAHAAAAPGFRSLVIGNGADFDPRHQSGEDGPARRIWNPLVTRTSLRTANPGSASSRATPSPSSIVPFDLMKGSKGISTARRRADSGRPVRHAERWTD